LPSAAQEQLRRRAVQAVQAVQDGMTQLEAARIFGVTRQTIGVWVKKAGNKSLDVLAAKPQDRPVFITERTIRISENQRKFLEIECPQEAIDSFLKKYQISPCLDAPYSRIFQVCFNDDPYAD